MEPDVREDPGFELDELIEFLAADRGEVRADPLFKLRLRRKLWKMIRRVRAGSTR